MTRGPGFQLPSLALGHTQAVTLDTVLLQPEAVAGTGRRARRGHALLWWEGEGAVDAGTGPAHLYAACYWPGPGDRECM